MACAKVTDYYFSFVRQEDVFLDFLLERKLIKDKARCRTCRAHLLLNRSELNFRCQRLSYRTGYRNRCCFTLSAKKGTFFENSRLSPMKIIEFVYWWCWARYPRYQVLMDNLVLSAETVNDWSSFCREVCVRYLLKHTTKLGGEGKVVEIDEAKFGKRKYVRGDCIEGQWVFGGFERGTKNIFLIPVERRDKDTLLNIIKEWILPGTTIVSDIWGEYDCLSHEGYRHLQINHCLHYADPQVHTDNIEKTWRDVRGGIPRYGRRKAHFVGYLAEFIFKRKWTKDQVIGAFIDAIADVYPPSY